MPDIDDEPRYHPDHIDDNRNANPGGKRRAETAYTVAEQIITAILVHGFENDADAERVLREQQSGVARLLARALTGGPSIETTGAKFTPETLRRGIELMKAGDAKRREMPFPASETGEPVASAAGATAYTVAERTFSGRETGRRVLVNADEIKAIMDGLLHVGQINSRQGDDSKPYAVFNKRDCAIKIAQVVNDRFNAKRGA